MGLIPLNNSGRKKIVSEVFISDSPSWYDFENHIKEVRGMFIF